jgi:reverse gyrase
MDKQTNKYKGLCRGCGSPIKNNRKTCGHPCCLAFVKHQKDLFPVRIKIATTN